MNKVKAQYHVLKFAHFPAFLSSFFGHYGL